MRKGIRQSMRQGIIVFFAQYGKVSSITKYFLFHGQTLKWTDMRIVGL